MIKLFKHYLLKRSHIILITTILLVLFICVSQINVEYIYTNSKGVSRPNNLPIAWLAWFAIILALIVGIKEFSFKMSKISIDQLYSLPIKRYKLYLVKYIIGLIEIVVPLIFSFIAMYIIIISKDNMFDLSYMFPFILSLLGTTIVFYTVVIFFFTRCNTVFDGFLNVTIGIFALAFIMSLIDGIVYLRNYPPNLQFSFFYPIFRVTNIYSSLINYSEVDPTEVKFFWISFAYILPIALVMAAYMFLTLHIEKSENAEYQSNSLLAYRLNVPIAIITSLGSFAEGSLIFVIIFGALGYLLFVIKNRKFKISKIDLLILASSIILGIIFGIIVEQQIFYNPPSYLS